MNKASKTLVSTICQILTNFSGPRETQRHLLTKVTQNMFKYGTAVWAPESAA